MVFITARRCFSASAESAAAFTAALTRRVTSSMLISTFNSEVEALEFLGLGAGVEAVAHQIAVLGAELLQGSRRRRDGWSSPGRRPRRTSRSRRC